MRIRFVRSEVDRRLYMPGGDVWPRYHWLVRAPFHTPFLFSGDVLDLRLPPLLFQYVLRF